LQHEHAGVVCQRDLPTRRAAEIEFEARDAASPLRRREYSLDATGWVPLEAADGVIDSQQERFVLSLDKLAPGGIWS
jgi:hypothetical protein